MVFNEYLCKGKLQTEITVIMSITLNYALHVKIYLQWPNIYGKYGLG